MTPRRRRLVGRTAAGLLLAAGTLSACGDGQDDEVLDVYAAASLRTVFEELGDRFERDHPDTEVRFTFAGSADLSTQLNQGAPADLIATADEPTLATVDGERLRGEPVIFATNALMIAVANDNPAGIKRFADLARDDVDLVVCAPQVPCGASALALAASAGLDLSPVSEELNVTDALGKVRSGQADAALVYRTEVIAAAGDVTGINVPGAATQPNRYPIAVTAQAPDELADAFLALVTGPTGAEVLRTAGFGLP